MDDSTLKQWYVLKWAFLLVEAPSALHPIFPAALRILKEFGGLRIWRMHFDPASALLEADYASWIYYQWRLNDQLFPLAYYDAHGELMLYAVGTQGKVYGLCGISGNFFLIGKTIDEALENMILNHTPTLLHDGYAMIEDAEKVAAIQRLLPTN